MEWIPKMTMKVSPLLGATGVEDPGRVDGVGTGRLDPEVPERAKRRTFTAQYKLDIVAEYDAAPDGEKGAVPEARRGAAMTGSSGPIPASW